MSDQIIYIERGDESPWPKNYIGDGVYASFDGHHIWLRAEGERAGVRVTNEIALEPTVYQSLVKYAARLYACCQFAPGDRVRYVPHHALGDRDHEDCEDGTVSSQNGAHVFVRFGSGDTAQACDPDALVKL